MWGELYAMPEVDGITRQFLKKEIVETGLHYVNHEKVDFNNPFKTVTHHRTFETDSGLRAEISKLIKLKIPQRANMSVTALLDLPMDVYEMVMQSCLESIKSSGARAAELKDKLEEEIN